VTRALLPVVALSLFAVAWPSGQSADAGRVTGHVTLTTRVPGSPLPSTLYPSRAVDKRKTQTAPEIRNVVVYLKNVALRGELPTGTAELRQEDEAFVPHVLAITKGSAVMFSNQDSFFHNVFSLSGAANFDLGRFPRGTTRTQVFKKAGIVKVFCHIHSQMSATILVLDNPYFAIPETDGSFVLDGVPPGQYTIVGWHERVGERKATVRVEAGRPSSIDLSLPVQDPP
jgi:plastocyanin